MDYKSKYLEMKLKYINAKNKLIGGANTTEVELQTILYHGSSINNYKKLKETGFDLELIGTGFGTTLGRGIYLTPHTQEALSYAEDAKNILAIPIIGLKAYKLTRSFSVDCAKHRRDLKKLTDEVKIDGYNALESQCGNEIVIFPEFIDIIKTEESEIIKI
tara:strand:- start:25 stop:507 length:483 start_codon:yes stop_codon:yes gene_type:complete